MGLEDVSVKDILKGQVLPDNPYSHQIMLIRNPKEEIRRFSDLLHEHLMLGNFGDERLLSLYQEEADVLTELFALTKKHPGFTTFFSRAFWSFIIRVDFTRSFKGLERLLQAILKIPKVEEPTGFGGLLQKVSGKKKKPEDMLLEMLLYEQYGGLYT
jgi:hypothetical protein